MKKAYEVTTRCGDGGSDIVWAEKPGDAKTLAMMCDCCEDEPFVEIRVKRIPDLDYLEYKVPTGGSAWQSDEIRKILVRDHNWACVDVWDENECDACCAKEWCHWMETYQTI